jgi:hypothetical protein
MRLLKFVIYMSKETTAEIYTYFFHILISDVVRIEINFKTDHMDKDATKFNHSVHSPTSTIRLNDILPRKQYNRIWPALIGTLHSISSIHLAARNWAHI